LEIFFLKKEYITYKSLFKSDNPQDYIFIQDCMSEILQYTTKRFAFLKKKNQLGNYDQDKCDIYRDSKNFTINKKKKNILSARYARAIDISIQAKCDSLIKLKKLEIESKTIKQQEILQKFTQAQERHKNAKKSYKGTENGQYSIDCAYKNVEYFNNKLVKINQKIDDLQFQLDNNIFNGIVFGGKKLFSSQFKQGANFDYFKEKWNNRGDEFECGGSAGENYGNKQFQLTFSKTIKNKHFFDLQINVPYRLRKKYGQTYTLKNIYFPRGQKAIKRNVDNHNQYLIDLKNYNSLKKQLKKINKKITIKKPLPKDYYCHSVSFLLKKYSNGQLGIHASIPRKIDNIATHDRNGVIGVDINYDNISISEINKVGKLLNSKVYRFNFGKTNESGHREQMINKHIKDIINYAKEKKKHIVIENLDFMKSKAKQLKNIDKKFNKILHSLAYAKIKERIRINCFLNGVVFIVKDAAYSSMLGKTLYAKQYGISTHQAAAYVMARRYYNLKEYYKTSKINFIHKDKACSLIVPADIYEKQDKLSTTKFWKLLYNWLSNEYKAPSRFYQETLSP
jgi:IS605 OrfB family transposase